MQTAGGFAMRISGGYGVRMSGGFAAMPQTHGRELNAYLYETDDDGDQWFHPQVWYKEDPASLNDGWDFLERNDAALLIPQSIVICEIHGISYDIRKS